LKKRWDRGKDFELSSYGDTQTSNLLPLAADIVPDESKTEVLESLLLNISRHHDDHLDTGIVGTKFLFDVLSKLEQGDVAFEIATKTSYPGYGYAIREGATTLWERWEYVTSSVLSSHNHIMFGSIDAWFYKSLVGINPDASRPAFAHFLVKPVIPAGLDFASGSLQTIRGLIAVDWQRSSNRILLSVNVPVNTSCSVFIPKLPSAGNLRLKEGEMVILENGAALNQPQSISGVRVEEKYVVCEVGSGSYSFTLEG
jgi:alpha-L-rhamnosidase